MLHIAVAGSPHTTPKPGGSLLGMQRAHDLGLKAMELEWVQRVPANPEHILKLGQKASDLDIRLTVHAPYFVNLNTRDAAKLAASKKRILDALQMAELAGAHSVCVHPAFYLQMDPLEVYPFVEQAVADIMQHKAALFPTTNLAFETMGKHSQFGTLEEVLALSKTFNLYPTVDFAHLHARANGAINSAAEWHALLDQYEQVLGAGSLQTMHMHYSGIEYTEKGERRHLPLPESDANWQEFLVVLKQRNVGGSLVVESPLLEAEALLIKNAYEKITL